MATCPSCGTSSRQDPRAIEIAEVLIAKPVGTWSLAGAQPKTVVYSGPQMSCRCGWSILGYIDADGYFRGRTDTQVWPSSDSG